MANEPKATKKDGTGMWPPPKCDFCGGPMVLRDGVFHCAIKTCRETHA